MLYLFVFDKQIHNAFANMVCTAKFNPSHPPCLPFSGTGSSCSNCWAWVLLPTAGPRRVPQYCRESSNCWIPSGIRSSKPLQAPKGKPLQACNKTRVLFPGGPLLNHPLHHTTFGKLANNPVFTLRVGMSIRICTALNYQGLEFNQTPGVRLH